MSLPTWKVEAAWKARPNDAEEYDSFAGHTTSTTSLGSTMGTYTTGRIDNVVASGQPWQVLYGTWGISAVGTAYLVTAGTPIAGLDMGGLAVIDMAANGTVRLTIGTRQAGYGMAVRVADAGNFLLVRDATTGMEVFRVTNYVPVSLGTLSPAVAPVSGDALEAVMDGTSVTFRHMRGGVQQGSLVVQDTVLREEYRAGMYATTTGAGRLTMIWSLLAWTDITADLLEARWKRGKQRELQRHEAGEATVVLRNQSQRYDPENVAGTYYPDVKVRRRCRIYAVHGGVFKPQFDGTIAALPQRQQGNLRTVEMALTDRLAHAARSPLSLSPWQQEVRRERLRAWYRMGEPEGSAVLVDSSQNGRHGLYAGSTNVAPAPGQPVIPYDEWGSWPGSATWGGAEGDPAAGFVGTRWSVLAWVSLPTGTTDGGWIFRQASTTDIHVLLYVSAGVLAGILTPGNNTGITVVSGGPSLYDGKPHLVGLHRDPSGFLALTVDGTEYNRTATAIAATQAPYLSVAGPHRAYGNPTNTGVNQQGRVQDVVLVDEYLPPARVAQMWAAGAQGWTGDLSGTRLGRVFDTARINRVHRSLEAGVSRLQATLLGGTALPYAQRVAEAENGALYADKRNRLKFRGRHTLLKAPYTTAQAQFGSVPGTDLPVEVAEPDTSDQEIINVAVVAREGGPVQLVRDSASVADYDPQVYERTDLLIESDTEAADHGRWVVQHNAQPRTLIRTLTLRPGADDAVLTQALGREIDDRVAVRINGSLKQEHIQGMEHHVQPTNQYRCTWWLSPADTQQYLILDDPVLGLLDGSNRLAY